MINHKVQESILLTELSTTIQEATQQMIRIHNELTSTLNANLQRHHVEGALTPERTPRDAKTKEVRNLMQRRGEPNRGLDPRPAAGFNGVPYTGESSKSPAMYERRRCGCHHAHQ